MTTPWADPPDWRGRTAAVLASGPSLTRAQCNAVREAGCRVIAINCQGIDVDCDGKNCGAHTLPHVRKPHVLPAMAPWADILFAADAKWWRCYHERALKFPGRKVTLRPTLPWREIYSLTLSREHPTFDERPGHVVSGGNSGYMALHLAVQLGAKRILLLGYDMRETDGRRHWHGRHPKKLDGKGSFSTWLKSFDRLAPTLKARGVDVINCTPNTALKSFKRMSLETALRTECETDAA